MTGNDVIRKEIEFCNKVITDPKSTQQELFIAEWTKKQTIQFAQDNGLTVS